MSYKSGFQAVRDSWIFQCFVDFNNAFGKNVPKDIQICWTLGPNWQLKQFSVMPHALQTLQTQSPINSLYVFWEKTKHPNIQYKQSYLHLPVWWPGIALSPHSWVFLWELQLQTMSVGCQRYGLLSETQTHTHTHKTQMGCVKKKISLFCV